MRRKSWCPSLLRWTILILSTLDHVTLLVTAGTTGGQHRSSRRIHLHRAIEISSNFKCREPQPRTYNLKDLIQNHFQNTGESVNQPTYIVLKRCDSHSGCCMGLDMTCTPVGSAIYREEIEIEIWSLETNDTRRQWIEVEQHGRCACEVTTFDERYTLTNQQPSVILL